MAARISRVQREMSRQAVTEGFALRAHYTPSQALRTSSPKGEPFRAVRGRTDVSSIRGNVQNAIEVINDATGAATP